MVNGYSIVTYQRPLKPSDEFDKQIFTNQSQAVIWATGPLNEKREVSFHIQHYLKKNHFIDFGRSPKWNCPLPDTQESQATTERIPYTHPPQEYTTEPLPESTTRSRNNERRRGNPQRRRPQTQQTSETSEDVVKEQPNRRRGSTQRHVANATTTTSRPVPTPKPVSSRNAWYIPPIECYEPDDGVFYAQMGPTGGKRGYPAITGEYVNEQPCFHVTVKNAQLTV